MILIAIPATYRDDLAPIEIEFVLTTDEPGIDMSEAISARAVVTRSDGEVRVWPFTIDEQSTSSATVTGEVDAADFFDVGGVPVAPATYSARFLVEFPDGERPLTLAWISVERF